MSTDATWQQAIQMLSFVEKTGANKERTQELFTTGLLADLLKARSLSGVDRDEFRAFIDEQTTVRLIQLQPDFCFGKVVKTAEVVVHDDRHRSFDKPDEILSSSYVSGMWEWKLFRHGDTNGNGVTAFTMLKNKVDGWIAGGLEHLLALQAQRFGVSIALPIAAFGPLLGQNGRRHLFVLSSDDNGQSHLACEDILRIWMKTRFVLGVRKAK